MGQLATERAAADALDLDPEADVIAETEPDTGCDLARFHPAFTSCQRCPLPACRFELPGGAARAVATALAVRRLSAAGLDSAAMAVALDVSIRTIAGQHESGSGRAPPSR